MQGHLNVIRAMYSALARCDVRGVLAAFGAEPHEYATAGNNRTGGVHVQSGCLATCA
jgi:hypothetical protein